MWCMFNNLIYLHVLRVDVIFLGQSQINCHLVGPVPHASVSFSEGDRVKTRCYPIHTGN